MSDINLLQAHIVKLVNELNRAYEEEGLRHRCEVRFLTKAHGETPR